MKKKIGFWLGFHTQNLWIFGYETQTQTQKPNPIFLGCECMQGGYLYSTQKYTTNLENTKKHDERKYIYQCIMNYSLSVITNK